MNCPPTCEFSLEQAFEFARNYAKKESPKASKILDFLVDKSKRDYLNLCFAYLRWVDDYVDDPSTQVNTKKNFIECQKNLISSLYKNTNVESSLIEEACIIYFAEYAISTNNMVLLDEVKNMMEALSMDVYRLEGSGIFSNDELDHYIELMSKSLFNILCNFTPSRHEYRREFYLGARFTTIALMIRDLEEDIDAGFINIGAEEIEKYKLDLKNLKNDKNFSFWLKDKIKYIIELLYDEVALLKFMPFKLRMLTCYSLIYRLPWIIRAKVYNYTLQYASERTFLKELGSYFTTFILSLNIFLKAFVYSKK
jgi:phytoene/squalene synthetase